MSMRQLWEGADGAEWVRNLDGRTKFCLIAAVSLLVLVVDNPRTLFYLFSGSLLLHILGRFSLYKWKILSILILLGIWGSIVTQSLFYVQPDRTPLFTLIPADTPYIGSLTGGVTAYREGMIYGAVQGLRSASMLATGLFVCWSSDPRQLLRALTAWRLPPQVAFMVVTALRFLPVLAAEAAEVVTALQLRSRHAAGRWSVVRNLPQVAGPLLARSLRRAQTLSLAVLSRGFLALKAQRESAWRLGEKAFSASLLLLAVAAAAVKVIYLGAEQGFYDDRLRTLYDFSRLYL